MGYKLITTQERYDGHVAEIALGPPPANIVTAALMSEVSAELRALQSPERSHTKLIILRGQGEHFSYGASVEEHRAAAVGEMLSRFHALLHEVISCSIPTLAQVSGLCLGGGLELALACTMMACDEKAKIGVPEIRLGVFPPAASVLLPYKMGQAGAAEMILTGRNYSGRDARRLGIANIVAESGTLEDTVAAFVEKEIMPRSSSSLRLAWQASRGALLQHYTSHIDEVERLYVDKLMSTHDAVEGIEAFIEKRAPEWRDN